MKYLRICITAAAVAFWGTSTLAADCFDQIKTRLASNQCTSIDFLSVLTSKVFKSQDTSRGTAYLSRDGRYHVTLDNDIYLCDGKLAYSYSASSNQVIVSPVDSSSSGGKELAFITRLDDYYKSRILKSNREYQLTRLATAKSGAIPDSLKVIVDSKKQRIVRIEYLDANDEKVNIILLEERRDDQCDDRRFVPNFPDSVETVKM
jgi:outer membrane lipoprotein-sorting protein